MSKIILVNHFAKLEKNSSSKDLYKKRERAGITVASCYTGLKILSLTESLSLLIIIAAITKHPKTISRRKGETANIESPASTTAKRINPAKIFTTDPLPPFKLIPPITAAAKAGNSASVAV